MPAPCPSIFPWLLKSNRSTTCTFAETVGAAYNRTYEFDSFIFVGPTSGGTWVVVDHERFLTDSPCHAGGVTYGYHKTNESDYYGLAVNAQLFSNRRPDLCRPILTSPG